MVNDNEKKESEKFFQKMWFWIIVIILFWFIGLISFGFWSHEKLDPIHKVFTANPDKIWDSFNILNSLFGAITVVLVYFTYKTQKEELEETRKALEGQEEVMKEEKMLNYLSFILDQKNKIKNLLYVNNDKQDLISWDAAFYFWYKYLRDNEAYTVDSMYNYEFLDWYNNNCIKLMQILEINIIILETIINWRSKNITNLLWSLVTNEEFEFFDFLKYIHVDGAELQSNCTLKKFLASYNVSRNISR